MSIDKDSRKSKAITFYSVPCNGATCVVARDNATGQVMGAHACEQHLAPLAAEATRDR